MLMDEDDAKGMRVVGEMCILPPGPALVPVIAGYAV